jgi:hypothetical protein
MLSLLVTETSGEIRQQAYRGLWNLAGRNAKQKELKHIQLLLNYNAFDLVTKLSYDNLYKDQDIITGTEDSFLVVSIHKRIVSFLL